MYSVGCNLNFKEASVEAKYVLEEMTRVMFQAVFKAPFNIREH